MPMQTYHDEIPWDEPLNLVSDGRVVLSFADVALWSVKEQPGQEHFGFLCTAVARRIKRTDAARGHIS